MFRIGDRVRIDGGQCHGTCMSRMYGPGLVRRVVRCWVAVQFYDMRVLWFTDDNLSLWPWIETKINIDPGPPRPHVVVE